MFFITYSPICFAFSYVQVSGRFIFWFLLIIMSKVCIPEERLGLPYTIDMTNFFSNDRGWWFGGVRFCSSLYARNWHTNFNVGPRGFVIMSSSLFLQVYLLQNSHLLPSVANAPFLHTANKIVSDFYLSNDSGNNDLRVLYYLLSIVFLLSYNMFHSCHAHWI